MDEVMSQLSFDEGIAMPVANEENKRLEIEVEEKQRQISKTRDEIDRFIDRIQSMSDHLKNVQQERQQTQELCNARQRETKTEEHFRQLAEREDGRLRSEIQRLQKELNELNERKNIYENNIFKSTELLEKMKQQMNWDQQALEAWLAESAKRDEDALILQKYTKVDEGKLKELSLKQEKMIEDRNKKRRALEHEITQTLTTQLELDKTAEEFRAAHESRQELLDQWENTIAQMRKRDEEMEACSLQLMEVKLELQDRQGGLKEKQMFLDNELNNNKEKEKKISASERQAAKLRLEYQSIEQQRIQFQDELETLKYTVDRTAKDLDNSRKKCNELKKEVETKKNKVLTAQEVKEELKEQLAHVVNTTMSAEERSQMLEGALKKEEARINEVERELARLRELQFKKTQELQSVRNMETNTIAEIQGAKAASRNLSSKLHKLDQDSLKQQEIVYNQDFQLQQLERKMARLMGERSNEEKALLEAKIKVLQDVLDGHNNRHELLTTQLKKLAEDLRRANRDLTKGSDEKQDLSSKIGELNLHNDSSERELRKITSRKQDLMVDENILKLEIKRLRDTLFDRANNVLSLEERRLLLDTAMKERREAINIHRDMLQAQQKSAEEERQKISGELHERFSKIDKLRKRYEILMVSMAPPEGEEEKTQAYYVIKAAQDKEELQRTGDDLDAKIRKAEKEIRALENTLRLMSNRNQTFRASFQPVEETSEDYEQKIQLEEQLRAAQEKHKYKRRQMKELQEDLETMSNTLNTLNAEEQQLLGAVEEKDQKIESIRKELSEQEEKKQRAENMVEKLRKEIRSAKKAKDELPEEKDIKVRELRDFNNAIMKQIGEAIHQCPDISDIVHEYFQQAGLPPPPAPGQSSARSNMSQTSSRSSLASSRSESNRSDTSTRQAIGTAMVELGLGGAPGDTRMPTPKGTPGSKQGSKHSTPKAATPTRGTPTTPVGSKPPSVRGTPTGSKPPSVRGTPTGSKPPSVRGTPTGSKPSSARSSTGSQRR